MKKTKFLFLLLCLIVLIVGGVLAYQWLGTETEPPQSAADTAATAAPESRTAAPDFTLVNQEGQTLQLSDLFGKPIVLNFWASWCPPCKNEMPHFQKLYEELGDSVQFVMLNMTDGQRETEESARAFLQESQYTFPVYFDTQQEGAIQYRASSIPVTYIISADGYITGGSIGQLTEQRLRSMLAEVSPAAAQ